MGMTNTETSKTETVVQYFDGDQWCDSAQGGQTREGALAFAAWWAAERNSADGELRIIERTTTEVVIIRVGDEAMECSGCGVQLLNDGTVDALDEESADHFVGCPVAPPSARPQAACDMCGSSGDHEPGCGSGPSN
jgi:hypothetical protein